MNVGLFMEIYDSYYIIVKYTLRIRLGEKEIEAGYVLEYNPRPHT